MLQTSRALAGAREGQLVCACFERGPALRARRARRHSRSGLLSVTFRDWWETLHARAFGPAGSYVAATRSRPRRGTRFARHWLPSLFGQKAPFGSRSVPALDRARFGFLRQQRLHRGPQTAAPANVRRMSRPPPGRGPLALRAATVGGPAMAAQRWPGRVRWSVVVGRRTLGRPMRVQTVGKRRFDLYSGRQPPEYSQPALESGVHGSPPWPTAAATVLAAKSGPSLSGWWPRQHNGRPPAPRRCLVGAADPARTVATRGATMVYGRVQWSLTGRTDRLRAAVGSILYLLLVNRAEPRRRPRPLRGLRQPAIGIVPSVSCHLFSDHHWIGGPKTATWRTGNPGSRSRPMDGPVLAIQSTARLKSAADRRLGPDWAVPGHLGHLVRWQSAVPSASTDGDRVGNGGWMGQYETGG